MEKEKSPAMYTFGRGIGEILGGNPKHIMNPVLGNLSSPVQSRIGKNCNWYNEDFAAVTSYVTNALVYTGLAGYIASQHNQEPVLIGSMIGLAAGVVEAGARCYLSEKKRSDSCASLLGKVASLPLEMGLGLYDGIKEGVQHRVDERRDH